MPISTPRFNVPVFYSRTQIYLRYELRMRLSSYAPSIMGMSNSMQLTRTLWASVIWQRDSKVIMPTYKFMGDGHT